MARILIVEDDAAEQKLLRALFEGAGHQVLSAFDGEQGYKTYLKKDIQVVITDIQMPKVDGIELIDSLKALFPDAQIIAISGKGPEMLAKAKSEGARAVLPKPVDRNELLKAVDEALADA